MLQAVKENLDIVITAMDRTGTFIYQDGKGLVKAGLKPHQFVGVSAFDLYSEETGTNQVRPSIAQTMVAIGVDLSRVAVFAELPDALKHCLSVTR